MMADDGRTVAALGPVAAGGVAAGCRIIALWVRAGQNVVGVDRVAAAADDLTFLGQGGLLGDGDLVRVQIIHARRDHHALDVLPWSVADALTRVDARGAARFGRAQIGGPVGTGRAGGLGERLAMGSAPAIPPRSAPLPLPTLLTKNDMSACWACAVVVKPSMADVTAVTSRRCYSGHFTDPPNFTRIHLVGRGRVQAAPSAF